MTTFMTPPSLVAPDCRARPSLRSLAKSLGVSHNTVALALKDDPRVALALRKKIQSKAEAEGYLASDLTRILITGRSHTIGIVMTAFTNPTNVQASGIVEAAFEASLVPIVLTSGMARAREEKQLQRLARLRVDGIILSPCWEGFGEKHYAEVLARRIPLVAINRPVPLLRLPEVSSDNYRAGQLAAEHMLARGHRRLFCLDSPTESQLRRPGRGRGFVDTCRAAGAEVQVYHLEERNREASEIPGLLDQALGGAPGRRPTAVFCHNDYIALAVYNTARQRGLSLPRDLSVVGCGNVGRANELHFLDFLTPPLTTIEQTPERVGRLAVSVLLELLDGRSVPPHTVVAPVLVERGSVATVRPAA